jgi:hypothetical protein
MKIWITRPDILTIITRGIPQCSAWLIKPHYSYELRGESDPIYSHLEKGWTINGEFSSYPSVKLKKTFYDHKELTKACIRGIFESVGDTVQPEEEFTAWKPALNAWWTRFYNRDWTKNDGSKTMLIELDVSYKIWFELFQKVGKGEVSYCHWLINLDPELPF